MVGPTATHLGYFDMSAGPTKFLKILVMVLVVAVVARPDEHWGETPCAFVTVRSDAAVSESELIEFCRENMAHFKCPKTIVFTDLPKTSTGKVQKYVLRRQAAAL